MTHAPEPENEVAMAAHMRMTACVAACAGIPTDKLRQGIVKELRNAATAMSERAEYAAQFLSTVAHGAAGDAAVVKAGAVRPRNALRAQAEALDALLREMGSE